MTIQSKDYGTRYQKFREVLASYPLAESAIRQTNHLITLLMPVVYGSLLVYLVVKANVGARIFPFVAIPASGFLALSLFRHWVNIPRPYEKWEIEPILEKDSLGHSFPSRHVFSATIISVAVYQLSPVFGGLLLGLSALLALLRVLGGVHYPRDVIAAYVFALLWGLLFLVI